jgi:hypothetical protein
MKQEGIGAVLGLPIEACNEVLTCLHRITSAKGQSDIIEAAGRLSESPHDTPEAQIRHAQNKRRSPFEFPKESGRR